MRTSILTGALVAVALALGACGGDDDNGDGGGSAAKPATTDTATTPAAKSALTIKMTEFAFEPKNAVAKAGKVTITAVNEGKVVHELVLLKTAADPAKLPKKGDEVDESKAVGEIADVDAGATKKQTFDLAAGEYAMVCALKGHYEGGMYGSLKVE